MKAFGQGSASVFLLLALLSCVELSARPRPPITPFPEFSTPLTRIDFDEAYRAGAASEKTVNTGYGELVESWSGHALSRTGPMLSPFVLPALDAGRTNFNSASGGVRFWFKPNWSSASVAGGAGPGFNVRLIELVLISDNDAAAHWSLQSSPDGSSLILATQTKDGPVNLLTADIAWSADSWHCLVLNYAWEGTELFIDGELAAHGSGVSGVAPADAGLVVGSTVFGSEAAEGEFDEICAFARPTGAFALALYYNTYRSRAALGPITAEEDAARSEAIAKYRAEQQEAAMQASFGMQSSTNCVTNGPVYLTNIVAIPTTNQGSIVIFDIMGGTNGLLYEVFSTTNLLGTNIANATWTCLATGMTCTTFLFTNEPQAHATYVLGTPKNSDADSLTDAYERLVSKTKPDDSDTDDDGLPDDWEVANGLNPLLNDASDDPDGDGLTNLQEYNGGTNSSNPHDVMVVAWGLNSSGQCNVPLGLRNVVAVAGGTNFSLALRADGSVVAWGAGDFGQTNVPSGLTNVAALSANWWDTLALRSNGIPVQWGGLTNLPPASATNLAAISMGYGYGFGVKSNGTLQVWGTSTYGTNIPSHITNLLAVAAATDHGVALQRDGRVHAWGPNLCSIGWCVTNVPADLTNGAAISAAYFHSLAVRSNGTVESWGYNLDGQTNTPPGLSNVIAVAAGLTHSLALKADGTAVAWGKLGPIPPATLIEPAFVPTGLTGIVAIAAGANQCLAIRSGRLTPVLLRQPADQSAVAGGTVTFNAQAVGLAGVLYQWQFNGVNIPGATNAALTLTNVQAGTEGGYRVVVTNGAGSTDSSAATFTLITPPVITAATLPQRAWIPWSNPKRPWPDDFTLGITATAPAQWASPLKYQWKFNGTNITNFSQATTPNFTVFNNFGERNGEFSVVVTNAAGSATTNWQVRVAFPGSVVAWGLTNSGQIERPLALTNVVAIAAGYSNSVAVSQDGQVIQWGLEVAPVPADLTNAVAVAAGFYHNLALRRDGTVAAWGNTEAPAAIVPTNLAAVRAIGAGWNHSVAVLSNGTVSAWGYNGEEFGWHLTEVPPDLTNATSVAAGALHSLALRSNGTVTAWGYNVDGQTNVPFGLSNIVALAGGGHHSLALRADGTVVAWGCNTSGECDVPAGLSNVMAIAAGFAHSLALKNDSTVVAWGRNAEGQTNAPPTVSQVQGIAAGGHHSLAMTFGPTVGYPVDVARDLVLIYNTNSADSIWVKDYYRAHRPMISNAMVLAVGCPTGEFMTTNEFDSQLNAPWQDWMKTHPTVRPRYIVLFLDIPSRMSDAFFSGLIRSVSFNLRYLTPGIRPFVTHIHMGDTNACRAYIEKLEFFGTNYSPGHVILSASAGGYGNDHYYFEDAGRAPGSASFPGADARNALLTNGIATNLVTYAGPSDAHLTNATNVTGFFTWGVHGQLDPGYATNGTFLFSGSSRWWIITTYESFNGQREHPSTQQQQGNFIRWFSTSAFGGINYLNTPVGAISHTEEPSAGVNNPARYFPLWAGGRSFAICAWWTQSTVAFQAIGDPLVKQ